MGRKKRHDIRVRMSDEEYAILKNRIDDCGISIQDYGVRMLLEQPVVTRMEIDELKNISSELHDAVRVHRGFGNNINQVARKVNSVGCDIDDIVTIQEEYRKDHEALERIWMIARRLVSNGSHKNDRP